MKMQSGLLILAGSLLLPAGCTMVTTATGDAVSQQLKIDRISAEELARLTPLPPAKLTLDDLLRLTKEGNSPEQIIAQIKAADAMYELTPGLSIELSRQGLDSKVLDYIHESRQRALMNSLADEINRREKQKQAEITKLKNRVVQQRNYDPLCRGYYGVAPYGFGGYGRHPASHFGWGAGVGFPLGCW